MIFNPFSLSGKNILITGASSGIGRQTAIDCSKMGATVFGVGRNAERLADMLANMHGEGHRIFVCDITDTDKLQEVLGKMRAETGPLDGFVHCAGIEKSLPLRNFKASDCLDIYKTNFVSAMEILKFLTKKGNYNDGFKAVLVASITSIIGRPATLNYTASKGAIVSAVRGLAVELAPKGININCVSPGTVLTPMIELYLSQLTEEERQRRESGFPLGIGSSEDVSSSVIFLLSAASKWITGQNLVVDGGYTIQ